MKDVKEKTKRGRKPSSGVGTLIYVPKPIIEKVRALIREYHISKYQ